MSPSSRRQYPVFVSGLESAIFYILMDIPTTRCFLAFGYSFIDCAPFPFLAEYLLLLMEVVPASHLHRLW